MTQSERWNGIQQWTKQESVTNMSPLWSLSWHLEHWHCIRFDGTRVVRVGIENSTLVCSLNGFWIFPTWKLSVTACHTYTLLTQFNSFLTVTPIYALDETLDVKVVKHCHCWGTNFHPVQNPYGRGKNYEIFINWYYLGEAEIGYMNVCIKTSMQRHHPALRHWCKPINISI